MSGFDGLETEPDGDDRWRVLEVGRPTPEAAIATVRGTEEHGFTLDSTEGAPTGPYGGVREAVEALAMWRLARFRGDRP